jgi:hypothetical protein
MASTVNSELYNAMLLIAKSENKVGRLQLEVFSVMLAWFQLLPILHFQYL